MAKSRVVLLMLAAMVLAAPARADQWTKKYTFNGKPELRINSNHGSIDVRSSDQKGVEVYVRSTSWRIPQDVEVIENQSGDHLELEVRVPRWSFHLSGSHRLEIEMHVPREADLDLHSGNGDISVQPVAGNVRISTGNGNINTNGLSGEVRIDTGNGRVEGSGLSGSLEAGSGNGHIHVSGRFDVLRLKSGNGSIEAEAASGSKMASGWGLRTGNGSITLRLPDGFNAELDAHTGMGKITTDFPVTVSGSLSRSTLHATLGSGGPSLEVHSGLGSIRLERM